MSDTTRLLRNALGRFATGVTIVTTTRPDGEPLGMTVNSFASVSLDPPLVAWCLDQRTPEFNVYLDSHGFVVQVLSADQAELAWRFADDDVDKFADVSWSVGLNGLPVLADTLACFQCLTRQHLPAGDHHILIGEVMDATHRPGTPLIFVDSQLATPATAETQQYQQALRASERRFRTLFEQTPSIAVQGYDAQRRVIFWNQASEKLYGYPAEEALGQTLEQLMLPEALWDPVAELVDRWLAGGSAPPAEELHLKRKDGSDAPVFSNHVIQYNTEGEAELYCLDIDLSALKQAEERLQLTASVFTHTREAIIITDAQGRIIEVNQAFSRISGYARDEVIGKNPRILQSGQHNKMIYVAMWRDLKRRGYWSGELWNRRKNGELYAEMLTINAVYNPHGQVTHYVSLASDITAQKEYQQQLEHLIYHDPLTGLSNRVMLTDRLQQAMAQARRRRQQLAVAYIDLDGFKAINEYYGTACGDQLLITTAERLARIMREGDTLARLGGDEFIFVFNDLTDVDSSSAALFTRLLSAVAEPIVLDEQTVRVSASLGVTYYPQAEEIDADQLLRQADQAMYSAKLTGKNRYQVFDAPQDRSLREYHEILKRLQRALADDEFVLYYQPKVNLRSGALIGAEALIRWQHPERGLLPPGAFLPIVDENALSVDLGEWVIKAALQQIADWQTAGLNLPVSINVSARHIQQPDFTRRLAILLDTYPHVAPEHLELEILETHALKDTAQVSQTIRDCSALGVHFALDDFGTGYASLTYLKQLPVRLLKVDQSFVRDMLDDVNDLAILDGVLSLAAAFGRQVIAEGVETNGHAMMLMRLGCELAQGYSIARPMPARDLPAWATHWQPDPAWAQQVPVRRDDLPVLYAQVEHRAWLRNIDDYLHGRRNDAPLRHHPNSPLKLWLDSKGRDYYGDRSEFHNAISLDDQLTQLETEVLEWYRQGQAANAQAGLETLNGVCQRLFARLNSLL